EGAAPSLPCLPAVTAKVPAQVAAVAVSIHDDIATRTGLALHRLPQWRPTPAQGFECTADHTQAVAREFDLDASQARAALAMAQRIVVGEAAWAWDAAQLDHWGNEVELFHQGELFRLDRLVHRRDTGHWWVLDYKSALNPE